MGVTHRKPGLRALVIGAVMALLLGPALAVNAEEVDITYSLESGVLSVGSDLAIDLPEGGSQLTGSWNSETGDLNATLGFFPFEVDLAELVPGAVGNVSIQGGAVTGNVPPDGSDGSITTAITVGLEVVAGGEVIADCELGPVDLTLTANLEDEGEFIQAEGAGFTVPPATGGGICDLAGELLGLPTTDTAISLTFVAGELPPPPPPPAPTPAPDNGGEADDTGDAEVVTATPSLTG